MKWRDQWQLSFRNIFSAPVRSLLTVLGMSIGIGAILAVLFVMPLLAYALAALVAALSRLTSKPVSGLESRLALFWALLAVSPAMLLAGLTAGLVGPGLPLALTHWLAGLGFLVIWGAGLRALAEA